MDKKQHFHSDEKLAILRACDPLREWQSLDDKRHCILREKTITGRQIEVTGGGRRRYELYCPINWERLREANGRALSSN